MSFGPNAVVPCPSESSMRHHAAHGELCFICWPDVERDVRCPVCGSPLIVRGGVVPAHESRRTFGWCVEGGRRVPGRDVTRVAS